MAPPPASSRYPGLMAMALGHPPPLPTVGRLRLIPVVPPTLLRTHGPTIMPAAMDVRTATGCALIKLIGCMSMPPHLPKRTGLVVQLLLVACKLPDRTVPTVRHPPRTVLA